MLKFVKLAAIILFIIASNSYYAFAQLNTNLVTNPGFESGITDWPSNSAYWQVDNSVAYTGNRSLRFTNNNPLAYPIVSRNFPVTRYATYRISAWIKTQNVTGNESGATIALAFHDSAGKYISGYYPTGLKGTNGWTQVSAECNNIPVTASKMYLYVYLRKGCTGTAWFDDISITLTSYIRFYSQIIDPHYRNIIYSNQPKHVSIGITVVGDLFYPTNVLMIDVSFQNENGELLSATALPNSDPDKWAIVTLDLASISPGTYKIIVNLIDTRTGNIKKSKIMQLKIMPPGIPMPKVYIDNQNRCIVDGKPFFPIGFFCAGEATDVERYISRLSDSKFNCLMNYSTPYYSLDKIEHLLDIAESSNIKIIFSVKDCYDGSPNELSKSGPWTGSFNVLKGMVSTYKSHPAVLAWYLNDELPMRFLPQIIDRYNYISSTDPDHPAWQVLFAKQDIYPNVDSTDILGIDDYPVMRNNVNPNLYEFGDAAKNAVKSTMSSRAVWMVSECSRIRYDGINLSIRPPTYNEIMCEAYQALTNGARGILFFSLNDLLNYDGETQWNVMKKVSRDLYSLNSFVTGIDVPSKQTTVSDKRVSTLTRSVYGILQTIAVNPYNESISLEFIPWNSSNVERIYSNSQQFRVSNGRIYDILEPYGTRNYIIIYK
ncbi:MAG: carbohydrate binding domain-containing protein [Armatimonadota bacterium]